MASPAAPELGQLAPTLLRHFLEDDDLPVEKEVSVLTFSLHLADAWHSSGTSGNGTSLDSLLKNVRLHRVAFKDAWSLLATNRPLRANARFQALLKAIMKDSLAGSVAVTPVAAAAPAPKTTVSVITTAPGAKKAVTITAPSKPAVVAAPKPSWQMASRAHYTSKMGEGWAAEEILDALMAQNTAQADQLTDLLE